MIGDLNKAAGSAERIFDLMATDKKAQKGKQVAASHATTSEVAGTVASIQGPILFQNVNFAYPTRKDFPVFKGLYLEIKEDETIALVGPSGRSQMRKYIYVMMRECLQAITYLTSFLLLTIDREW